MNIDKIISGLERAMQIIGTQGEQGYKYKDCSETIAIKEAIEIIKEGYEIS